MERVKKPIVAGPRLYGHFVTVPYRAASYGVEYWVARNPQALADALTGHPGTNLEKVSNGTGEFRIYQAGNTRRPQYTIRPAYWVVAQGADFPADDAGILWHLWRAGYELALSEAKMAGDGWAPVRVSWLSESPESPIAQRVR